jgi:hypothetical protein
LKLEIGSYIVNQLISGDPQLFVMPQDAPRKIDLSSLGGTVDPPVYSGQTAPVANVPSPRTAMLPYR